MKSIKGTQTEKNLLKSFAGESQARNRYDYFGSKARKEGYRQVAEIFERTSQEEREHAKRFFNFLEGGDLEIQATFPAGKVGSTLENLLAAAQGEHEEHTALYPEFARVAREEGFLEVAVIWDKVSVAEKGHEDRYRKLAANLKEGRAFKREAPVWWRCMNCGYLVQATEAPGLCPACLHPQAHFELLAENY
ncbi:MAG: rubrerythrin family protein [Polyangia bacterium]|jgi:rubrerythrin|nr:rubrerythrin family protein [Polyangia bacterium]